jgi:nitrogen permease regulator 3-like protein
MSSVAPPPNPCLVAIVLVVQSRAGPRFVYHYPPNPLSDSSSQRRGAYRDDDSSSSSDDDSSSSEDDDATTIGASSVRPHISDSDFGLSPQGKKARNPDEDEDDTSSPEGEENYRPPWETVLGFTTDALQKLLCPARTWHKRRFEFGINDLAFIGWPVFVREDGTWQKRKKTREGRRKKKRKKPANGAENEQEGAASGQENGDDIDEGLGVSEDENAGTDADEENDKTDVKQQKNPSLENSGGTSKGGMSMFNVVFVLNPTALEYPYRVREMYENVIKKFARALKWEQAENNYVWKQSKQIIARKEKAREDRTPLSVLDADIRRDSSLARSFADVYKYITSSEIASVSFSSDDSISIQIPPITSISVLPSATETPLPGVWLTTADSVTSPADDPSVTIENPSVGPSQLAKHFALLLLDSEASILKSLEPSAIDLATAMAHYVQSSTPTKSFAQISAISRIPLAEIQVLASHLVYWRRAQAIPPLHQRDTYIVSPNADLRKLSSAAAAYSSAFPALPSLPRMLSLLSGPPRNYGSVIPSKDHKEAYFAILAWLLRGGWVTQLRTFAWIRVSGDVKRAVAEQMALEDVERQKEASATTSVSSHTDSTSPSTDSPPVSRATTETNDYNALRRPSTNAASPHYTRSNFPHSHSHQPSSSQFTASLLLSPHRATPLESRWLDYLASSFPPAPTLSPDHTGTGPSPQTQAQTQHPDRSSTPTHTHSPAPGPTPHAPDDHGQPPKDTIAYSPHLPLQEDLATLWPIFTKYLNGHDALEKIAVREGMKRKSVWSGLARLGVLDGPARSDHPFVAATTAGGARSGSEGGKGKGKGRLGTRMGTGMGMAKEVRGGVAFMVEGEDDGEDGEDGEGELEKEMVDVGRRVVGVSHW